MESVFDYPRPPVVVPCGRRVTVALGDETIARSDRGLRVLETASPPTVYVPMADVQMARLEPAAGASHCEWKGRAAYFDVVAGGVRTTSAAWHYPEPVAGYGALREHVAFYPGRVACWLGSERAQPQPGRFYGGWVTAEIQGPFKGEPGTGHW